MLFNSTSSYAYWIVVAVVTLVGAIWLIWTGPVPVVRITTPLSEIAPFWYMLVPFPFLGMLVAEFVALWIKGLRVKAMGLALVMGALVAVSQLRLTLRLPLSGHIMMLVYFCARRAWSLRWRGRLERVELIVACGMLVLLLYVKLVWWRDAVTPGVGALAGLLLWAGESFAVTRIKNRFGVEPGDR